MGVLVGVTVLTMGVLVGVAVLTMGVAVFALGVFVGVDFEGHGSGVRVGVFVW
jgi:hypothetical protein